MVTYFAIVISCALFGGGPCTLPNAGKGRFTVSLFLRLVQTNFLHYRALAPKVTVKYFKF